MYPKYLILRLCGRSDGPLYTKSNACANPGLQSCNFCELVLKGQGNYKKRGVRLKEVRIKNLPQEFVKRVASRTALHEITRYRHFRIKTAKLNVLKNSMVRKYRSGLKLVYFTLNSNVVTLKKLVFYVAQQNVK